MTSYLLLRNNKESGPYTLEEIVRQGLKAYDLVWVNGKSAAWRYPGEIPELIDFAPPVEEQPYDRFYKKSSDNQKDQVVATAQATIPPVEIPTPVSKPIQQVEATPQPIDVSPLQIPEPTPEKAAPTAAVKKSVFVTMPVGQRRQEPATTPSPQPSSYEKYQPPVSNNRPIAEEPIERPAKTITIRENPVTAQIKYSQPLDEIKEMYVKTLQQRKQRIANKAFILQTLKKVAVVVVIIGAGILIGLDMNSNSGKKLVASIGRGVASTC